MAITNRKSITNRESRITNGDGARLQPASRAAWRAWLAANRDTSSVVWVVFAKKHTGIPSLTYDDAVEEALCFGWIDGVRHAVDAEFYEQRFSPRRPKSVWSGPNKGRVARMIEQGLMTSAGLALVKLAQRIGTWDAVAQVQSSTVPKELRVALDANARARATWDALSPGARKQLLSWLSSAKREQTRSARVQKILARMGRNATAEKSAPRPSGRTKAAPR